MAAETTYFYAVLALSAAGNGPQSTSLSATTPAAPKKEDPPRSVGPRQAVNTFISNTGQTSNTGSTFVRGHSVHHGHQHLHAVQRQDTYYRPNWYHPGGQDFRGHQRQSGHPAGHHEQPGHPREQRRPHLQGPGQHHAERQHALLGGHEQFRRDQWHRVGSRHNREHGLG